MSNNQIDPQSLEAQMLDTVRLLHRGTNALMRLQITIMGLRARLRNEVMVFKSEYPKVMYDDLLYAMVQDDALPIEEILVAFDLDRSGFEREIARIQKEKQK